MKLTTRKHVRAPPDRNTISTESHSDGQDAGYFLRTLWTVLLELGSSEPPLFIEILRLLHGNSYLWCVRVVIYEGPTTDCIHRISQHKELQQQQQWREQPDCQPTATPYAYS
jgi:hypothetical protein